MVNLQIAIFHISKNYSFSFKSQTFVSPTLFRDFLFGTIATVARLLSKLDQNKIVVLKNK